MAAQSYNAAVDMVDRNVREGRGAKTAFTDPSRKLTYGELADNVARVGPMLKRLGLGREDRIAISAVQVQIEKCEPQWTIEKKPPAFILIIVK